MPRTGVPIRKRGKCWHGDFRRWGGKQRTLSPHLIGEIGGQRGVTTRTEAERIAEEYVRQLRTGQGIQTASRISGPRLLEDYSKEFLGYLRETPRPNGELRTDRYVADVARYLKTAIEHFGANRPIGSITPAEIERYVAVIRRRDYSGRTVRVHLDKLSQMFRRAVQHRVMTYNPVDAIRDDLPSGKPQTERGSLEASEAWALMEAAREYDRSVGHYMHPLVVLWLHTGMGPREAQTRRVGDIVFAKDGAPASERGGSSAAEGYVLVQPNVWSDRRLKTEYRVRQIPLWPDCSAVLAEYTRDMLPEAPLFPSPRLPGVPVSTVRRAFSTVIESSGIETQITPYWLRHTYASHRLQTLEGGAPIALFSVARELGHASTRMLEQHYGHLILDRSARSEVVTYRPQPTLISGDQAVSS